VYGTPLVGAVPALASARAGNAVPLGAVRLCPRAPGVGRCVSLGGIRYTIIIITFLKPLVRQYLFRARGEKGARRATRGGTGRFRRLLASG